MDAVDIESPPYPSETVNADVLYETLRTLRSWVIQYRDEHNKAVGQDVIPTVKELPDRRAYTSQPIISQWSHLLVVRHVRESWDHLVRSYEDDWDDPDCARQRVMLLQATAILLNNAFIPQEYREARKMQELDELQQLFSRVNATVVQQLQKGNYDPKII